LVDDPSLTASLLQIAKISTLEASRQPTNHVVAHMSPLKRVLGSLGLVDLLGYGPLATPSLAGQGIVVEVVVAGIISPFLARRDDSRQWRKGIAAKGTPGPPK
jgi:hypothetical protein